MNQTNQSNQEDLQQASKELQQLSNTLTDAWGYLDCDAKITRLNLIETDLALPEVWQDVEKSRTLGQEKARLEKQTTHLQNLRQQADNLFAMTELLFDAWDGELAQECFEAIETLATQVADVEFQRMFSNQFDTGDAYLEIQAGSGGTEAQDWAQMLMRMYLRWCDVRGFTVDIEEMSRGEVAGVKGAMLRISGDYAYGWLRTESGVHRLVRKSPFDSGNRRHTSFASIFVMPQIDADIDVEINPAELRIDTYRASGAGGQHVNKTDSAVRITHLPTNIVVQCQSQRSQHKNKAAAMNQLRAKLFEQEQRKQEDLKQDLSSAKTDISWGNQIRSYVLDDSRIKDLRTGVETGKCDAVLDGEIDVFLRESLRQQV